MPDDVGGQLAALDAFISTNDDGQVVSIRFSGDIYNDSAILQLAKITGVQTIDIRETKITTAGASQLRDLMPRVSILH